MQNYSVSNTLSRNECLTKILREFIIFAIFSLYVSKAWKDSYSCTENKSVTCTTAIFYRPESIFHMHQYLFHYACAHVHLRSLAPVWWSK